MKKTIEEVAEERYREYPNNLLDKPELKYNKDINCFRKRKAFINGAKYQSEQMQEDMQEYAEFCIRCNIEGLPLLSAIDWFNQLKK